MSAKPAIHWLSCITLICLWALPAISKDSCRDCHLEAGGDLAKPVQAMDADDVHAGRGFSCASCHGGDPEADDQEIAMSKARGFLGVPAAKDIPQFCARCHAEPEIMRKYSVSVSTDQYEKYWTSQHGIALKAGKNSVATCSSCHGAHGIYAANNPRSSVWAANVPKTCNRCHGDSQLMSQFGLASTVFQDYSESVHGQALLERHDTGAPACNDCHGNHGAVPPGVESVAQVCRQCHINNAEMFLASPHRAAFDAAGLPECVACHQNHRIMHPQDDWLGPEGEHSCGQCHAQGDKGYTASLRMRAQVDSLRETTQAAIDLMEKVERRGIDVSAAQAAIEGAREALLKSRTTIHTANVTLVEEAVQPGLSSAKEALVLGQQGLADFDFRRRGLGIATIFITLLILAIWLKIRQMEKK